MSTSTNSIFEVEVIKGHGYDGAKNKAIAEAQLQGRDITLCVWQHNGRKHRTENWATVTPGGVITPIDAPDVEAAAPSPIPMAEGTATEPIITNSPPATGDAWSPAMQELLSHREPVDPPVAVEDIVRGLPTATGWPDSWTPDARPVVHAKVSEKVRPAVGIPNLQPAHTRPTYTALIDGNRHAPIAKATQGWRAWFRLAPGAAELQQRQDIATMQRTFDGPRTVVVVNVKGGIGKTTGTKNLAAAIGRALPGVIAWDNNETMGNLADRTLPGITDHTVFDLIRDLSKFEGNAATRLGDLAGYLRSQGDDQFDVLASEDNPEDNDFQVTDTDHDRVHTLLGRFYRLLIEDTGNNRKTPNYKAALGKADQMVLVSDIAEDSALAAGKLIASLRHNGHGDLVDNAVVVLTDTATPNRKLRARLTEFFAAHCRVVENVPFDRSLIGGGLIVHDEQSKATKRAWQRVGARVTAGLE